MRSASTARALEITKAVTRCPSLDKSSQSQISFIAWKIRKIGEASADTAATETNYMKGYYNLEEETIKVKYYSTKTSCDHGRLQICNVTWKLNFCLLTTLTQILTL